MVAEDIIDIIEGHKGKGYGVSQQHELGTNFLHQFLQGSCNMTVGEKTVNSNMFHCSTDLL